jgi:4-hydroxy-tetrahydrodipicolinate synthase
MTSTSHVNGIFSPVLTPFFSDWSPDTVRFVKHCRWLLKHEVGLAVFGTNSEANSLSVSEKRQLLDAAIGQGLTAARMMPGTGACSITDCIELTRHAVQAGCAGVLMLPPFYYKDVSDEGLYRAFATVIDKVADARLRIYLYHIPPVSQVSISRALIERLLGRYPGIVAGVKDSSNDPANTKMMIDEFGPRGFEVFAGSENHLLATMRAGGAGCITATANVNPAPIVNLFRTWQEADADQQQQNLDRTRAAFAKFPMIAAMKAAMAWKTGCPEWACVRAPLVELDPDQAHALTVSLNRIDFDMPGAAALR